MRLLEIKEKDYTFLKKLTGDISVMKNIKNGKIWSDETVEKFIEYCIEDSKKSHQKREQYWYIINVENTDVGMIGFEKHRDNNYYLRVIIQPNHQRKGYFSKAIELIKNRLKIYKNIDKLYAETHQNNSSMNLVLSKKYFFDRVSRYGKIKVNVYIIYLKMYTYLVKSDYISEKVVDNIFKSKGNWIKHSLGTSPDYIRLDGKHYSDKKYNKYRPIMKNIINDEKKTHN